MPPDDRPAFLRFARGDPFAAPRDDRAPDIAEQKQAPRNNLPLQLTSFIGREKEVADVRRVILTKRLVTVTGPGGTGKTRLSLEAVSGLLDDFADGVWLLELAALANPNLVSQALASLLGVREVPGRSFTEVLLDQLRPKRLLLILDNCEHLIQACAELADQLLRTCTQLTILATSREGFGIAGENVYPLPTLSLPAPNEPITAENAARSEAVRLFVERATAALPGFALTNDNALAVTQICRQLDGIPLAIELAAARVKLLRVEQLEARLDDRFGLLKDGSRTALPRHQTLKALIDWSYELLSERERALLQRLAVFAGGWTLEAAEAVSAGEGLESSEVLGLLAQLVNKSLVITEREPEAETRYGLLETIRQYTLAKLEASGEADAARRRHAAYFLALVQAGMPTIDASPMPAWLDLLETEHDNLRAALTWSQSSTGAADIAVRLVLGLSYFWWSRGYFSEARLWLEGALDLIGSDVYPPEQAEIHRLLGLCEAQLGDYAAGQAHLEHSLTILRDLGDRRSSAYALRMLGWMARERGDAVTARLWLEESVALMRELGDKALLADALNTLGEVAVVLEDPTWATTLIEEGLALWRELQDRESIGWALNHLGHVAQLQGEYERATRLHEESLALFRSVDLQYYAIVWAHQGLGETALAQSEAALATMHFADGLRLGRKQGYRAGMAWCLAGLAGAAVLDEEPERAAMLWGAAEALRLSIGSRLAPAARATRERLMAAAREQLGEEAFAVAWAEGQVMTMEQAIEYAI